MRQHALPLRVRDDAKRQPPRAPRMRKHVLRVPGRVFLCGQPVSVLRVCCERGKGGEGGRGIRTSFAAGFDAEPEGDELGFVVFF